MLVLSYSDRFRFNLYELCQRILQPSRNRHRAAFSDIQIRKLLLRQLRSRINAGSRLVHDQIHQLRIIPIGNNFCDELLRLAGCRAVADNNKLYAIFIDQFIDFYRSFPFLIVRRRWISHSYFKHLAGIVHDRKLTACTISRIDAKHDFPFYGRLQQQAAQVCRENRYSLLLGLLRQLRSNFPLNGRSKQPFVGILYYSLQRALSNRSTFDYFAGNVTMNRFGIYF
ncbi:hypothetical protein D3C77_312590 [compost metagenome]